MKSGFVPFTLYSHRHCPISRKEPWNAGRPTPDTAHGSARVLNRDLSLHTTY